MSSPRIAICAGSFDPPTNGHVDLFERAAHLFDRLIVAVLVNAEKQALFSVNERVAMLREIAASSSNIEVATFEGLLADYARARAATVVVRGLRSATEFADEYPMAMMNRHLGDGLETCFLMARPAVAHISSRLVKEIAILGGSLDGLVPPSVAAALARRRSS
jgi:pantetheine-phosphate adenylyltransferase